jgi:uncharacterized protein YjiS (DUF1127 family)
MTLSLTPRDLNSTARLARPFGLITSWLSSGAAAVAAARQRHRTYRVLSSLDDRTLHDIGLHRTMLLGVAVHGLRTLKEVAPHASCNPR